MRLMRFLATHARGGVYVASWSFLCKISPAVSRGAINRPVHQASDLSTAQVSSRAEDQRARRASSEIPPSHADAQG